MNQYPFEHPDDRYRGLDLWMVNDQLEDEEIERQVKEFREKGFYSVIFRTYNGLISDYPGPNFKNKVRVAIEAAKKCGLKIALQAGFMPSAYPALPKNFALHRIVPVPEAELTDEHIVLSRVNGIAFTDRIAAATVNMLDEASVEYYIRTAYEEMWSEFADEFGKTVISVWLDEPRFDNRYLTWTPDFDQHFAARYGYSIQEKIPALYYDIGDYKKVRYDYFTFIRDTMEKNYYSRVRDWCHAHGLSFAGHLMGEEYLATQISQSVASMPFYKYFDIPGVDMLASCHDWYDKPQLPILQKKRRYVERSMHVSAIQCTSAAEQTGKELKLCEMYGVTSPGFVFRDMMHMFDFFAANGINHQCMHALFYSPRGFRKRFYPQSFNVYQPFWENFRNVKDYVASVSSFISMGNSATDVAVLHPLETAYGLFRGLTDPNDASNRATVDDYDNAYYRLVAQLYSSQIGFHFADPSTVDDLGSISGNRFCVGKMSYGTLVIADVEVLTAKTFELISTFSKSGGNVYIKGDIPCRLDGKYTPKLKEALAALKGIRRFSSNEELIRALKSDARKTWEYVCEADASKTVINHRIDGESHYFFVHNGDCRKPKTGRLLLTGCHKAYSFDASTKQITELYTTFENGKTVIPFTNPVGASTMIFTSPDHKSNTATAAPSEYVHHLPLRNITCKIAGKNVLTLELCRYKTDGMNDFSEKEIAIERIVEKLKRERYEGNITLRFSFHSDFCAKGLKLILEDAKDCKIKLNGIDVDTDAEEFYYAKAFCVVTLPDVVKVGENVIELTRYTKPQVALKPSDDMKHLFELFRAPVGVDLERIHLLGDFLVETIPEYSSAAGMVRLGKRFFMKPPENVAPTSDVTSNGYPFYPGMIEYTVSVKITEEMRGADRILFRIGSFNGCTSTILLNGKQAGYIDREPYTLSLSQDLLIADQDNEIKVCLYGTFRNMFGPSHFVDDDPSGCSRSTWYEDFDHSDRTEYDAENHTNSFQLIPYGAGDFSLDFLKL
ncbi:MAG: hypothetical protein IJX39_06865 [Clostridia bacterium]|nr:hypothetical protein [Clostridia bacterium]